MSVDKDDVQGIYEIRNVKTGQSYVGVSSHVFKRLADHIKFLTNGSHINKLLEKSWQEFGPTAFVCRCVEVVDAEEKLPEREIFWIHKTNALTMGFNRKTDQFKSRTLISTGRDLTAELQKLGLGSMNQTLAALLLFYNEKSREIKRL